ncbi:RNA-directed DNA polymerase from mobile element jockey [Plakobranchus ocellatus]|uniref:RNA-directed DNA polymerase from mobile element jockey n=1 Tax=Plakobranchus ocellatus TaxID=259542 RepID=A0AAV3YE03_9GAST|nr:RNA-directed DNA polymerase from mobile element jockey [Plakobranchus ocellatus]
MNKKPARKNRKAKLLGLLRQPNESNQFFASVLNTLVTFADLSLVPEVLSFRHCLYSSQHGNGETDGDTGVFRQAMARIPQHNNSSAVRNAKDLYSSPYGEDEFHPQREDIRKMISKLSLGELFEQFPKPFLLLGDYNAHSPAWGDSRRDGRGRMLEEFIAENDLIILHSGEQTFVHSAYHSTLAIDMAVTSPSIAAECSWAAHSDLFGSDHFPIFLTLTSHFDANVNIPSFNVQKADWSRFGDLCKLSLDDSVADIEKFTSKLLDAARSSIPSHKGTKYKTRVPRNVVRLCRKRKRLKGGILKPLQ